MLDHFSASQINQFLAEPALWCLRRFWNVKGDVGPGAWRGTACEAALDVALYRPETPADELLATAIRCFDKEAQGLVTDKIEKERGQIERYLANMNGLAKQFGVPLARQVRIEWWPEGFDVPVIGWVDYSFETGDVDLKTTGRKPSFTPNGLIRDKAEHLRQMAIYNAARDKPQTLCYLTPANEPILYPVSEEEMAAALAEVKAAVRAMQRINAAADADDIAQFFPPRDTAGFRWDDITREKAKEVWYG